jgi:hypothetical protein
MLTGKLQAKESEHLAQHDTEGSQQRPCRKDVRDNTSTRTNARTTLKQQHAHQEVRRLQAKEPEDLAQHDAEGPQQRPRRKDVHNYKNTRTNNARTTLKQQHAHQEVRRLQAKKPEDLAQHDAEGPQQRPRGKDVHKVIAHAPKVICHAYHGSAKEEEREG